MKLKIYTSIKHSLQVLSCICTVLLTFYQTKGQNLLKESFNYTSGTLLTDNNWIVQSGNGTNDITVSNGNLLYPGSIGNTMGNKVPLANNGEDVYRTFTTTAAPIYSSLIVKVSSANSVGDFFYSIGTSIDPVSTVGAKLFIRSNGTGFSFGVLRGTGGIPSYETTVRPFNTNVLVVIKYEVVAGATNDAVKLYVNPPLASEPATTDATYNAATGTDAGAFSAIALLQGTAASAPTLEVDGINVGTTWASITSAIYDYGDVPTMYDFTKDGVYAPAAHIPLTGLSLGNIIGDVELSPLSVVSGADNNGSNGDGTDENAIVPSANSIVKGVTYTLNVPVNNPAATAKYLYGWIDFNNDGLFEVGELSDAIVSFSTTGATTQTLTWSSSKTATITTASKVYMRLRLSDRSLNDFTTAASGGALIDERSIGNGALSTASAADFPSAANGEVEDYQLSVVEPTTCTGGSANIAPNGTTTINGVQVTSSSSGDVGSYPIPLGGCAGNNTSVNSLFVGQVGSWSETLTFNKPVNNLLVILTATGITANENFIFNSNGGTVSIMSTSFCTSTIIGNTILSGNGANPTTGGGGVFRITSPTAFTSLTINGAGGSGGSSMALCTASITPQGPIISSITPNQQTVCQNITPSAITATATGAGSLSYKWYRNTTNTNVGGTLIAGATSQNYTPPATAVVGTIYYYVEITDTNASTLSSPVSVITKSCACYKPGVISGTALDSNLGITSLSRAGTTDPDKWPMVRKGGWMVLESKTKGFVVNRLAFDASGNPVGIPAANFVEGMMLYDTTNNCLKMYTSTDGTTYAWFCINTQTCPD
ncbi:hypothetical protein B0A69_09985 [Chryseobacterium shigense]|uniref:GEVED domain-containing protein n=1 Tax=Chryseobacterium shigense TaxID=297244 RepID=A0A1N7IGW1_9FLAO|nr:GEVED domain-containing protein [Chryseobacterium shigense]PQA94762.1 hypothetical protein B0A69_09985 [Chryseobacterium shigense]SIS36327.1 hypothetical protein SAMN05421639_103785 [Chryseobacterium shigense]